MWIFNNILYKIVAVLVACLLWSTAQGFHSVERSLDLPIVIENLPAGLIVTSQSATEVNLRIVGSQAAVRSAERNLLRYAISLEGARPGKRTVPIYTDRLALPRATRALARSPSSVVLEIERVASKTVPVRVDLVGEPPAGYRLRGVNVDPAEVTLEGARRTLRRVREVVTEQLELGRLRETTVRELPLSLGEGYVWPVEGRGQTRRVQVEVRIEAVE